ncbi:hypothetical protein [Methylobacterium sp. J-077]|uniref:hypothetical protein n=1 Tax=Methylobacterium sp. J-077 TaxID=2836656 RepID=UPI001FB9AE62|nr:hypothetical protein [Methylobacterium sp. J-077]MCJ2121040.1 hypothetical protein [Methylobacterium sp. J-077]
MTEHAFAVLLASAFTFGCAAIYELREHARHLTPILASVTTGLVLLAGMMALAQNGAISPADGSKPAPVGRAQASSWGSEIRMAAVQKPSTVEIRRALSEE